MASHALNVLEVFGEAFRGAVSFVDEKAAGDAAIIFDGFEYLLLALFAQARQRPQLAFLGQRLDTAEVADLKCAPDQGDGFWPEALDLHEFEHGGPVFLQ